MRYDIESDWYLLDTCNFRCGYCFIPSDRLGRKIRTFASPTDWGKAFDASGLTWLIHMTGGEPTVYPEFDRLCAELTRSHYISFNSNLDHASVCSLSDSVDPERVSFINAGLHYGERTERKGIDRFLRHVGHLREHGFPVFISVVATPQVLADMDTILELLRPIGMVPAPKLLRGSDEGKLFPGAYSRKERATFRRAAALARERYRDFLGSRPEPPSINPFSDDDFLERIPRYRGRSCDAGYRFVAIQPDGSVSGCSVGPLGNVRTGTFSRKQQPVTCAADNCFYFCEKHSRPHTQAQFEANLAAS